MFHCLHLEAFIDETSWKSCNYNLISNCCQFIMAIINRTRVLIGIAIFKAR